MGVGDGLGMRDFLHFWIFLGIHVFSGFMILSIFAASKRGSRFEIGDYESHVEFMKKHGFD